MAKHPHKKDAAHDEVTVDVTAPVVAASTEPVAAIEPVEAPPAKMVISTTSGQASLMDANRASHQLQANAEARRKAMHDAIKETVDRHLAQEAKG